MCDPVSVGIALSMTTAAIGVYSADQAAGAQQEALDTQREQQAEELSTKASVEMGERVKQARRERARIRVAAGESGVQGASFESQLMDSFAQENQDLALISKNARFADRASAGQHASLSNAIDRPSYLSAGLQIGASGYGGYQDGKATEAALRRLSIDGG